MLARTVFLNVILICGLLLFSSHAAPPGKGQISNRSAAELFTFDQFIRMAGARRAPALFMHEHENPKIALTQEAREALPTRFSWLDKGIMTSVKVQGTCGSCWAFAAVGMFESLIKRSDGIEEDLSEQQLVNCVPETSGCDGGFGWYAHLYMIDNGIVRESVYPYLDMDWECDLTAPSDYFLTNAWLYMKDGSEGTEERRSKIKQILMTYGPVDSVMALYEDFYRDYASGVYVYNGIDEFMTYHGVVIVGWADDDSVPTGGYWIVKNDWGPTWGENGYFRIAYASDEHDLIEFDVRYGLYNGIGNDPPFFSEMEEIYHGQEGAELIIRDYAQDPDGDAISYSGRNLPMGMNIDPATGIVSWIPDYTQAGDSEITITVSDGEYSFHMLVPIKIVNVKVIKR